MNIPVPNLIKTPVGASTSAGSALTLLGFTILPPVWPWWAAQSTEWRGAVISVLGFLAGGLAAWYKVLRAPGQKTTLELTPGPLPTVQAAPAAEPAAKGA
jgi:hypothetical protein